LTDEEEGIVSDHFHNFPNDAWAVALASVASSNPSGQPRKIFEPQIREQRGSEVRGIFKQTPNAQRRTSNVQLKRTAAFVPRLRDYGEPRRSENLSRICFSISVPFSAFQMDVPTIPSMIRFD
jgi:hypothetical protein